jgi:hypothetical protein
MECDLARQLLAATRSPADLDSADRARLKRHVADCPDCGPPARAAAREDEQFARAMTAVPLPDGLRRRLSTRLAAARSAWWRQTLVAASAACMAALLVTSLARWATRPVLDLVAAAVDGNRQPGQWKPEDQARADADAILRELGSPVPGPTDFDYTLFQYAARMDVYGLGSAPTLLFTRDDAYAMVTVVRAGQFRNVRHLEGQVGEDSGCWVSVRAVPGRPGWYYVIKVKGKPLQSFLRRDAAANAA